MIMKYTPSEAELILGERIQRLRIERELSCMDLARKIKRRESDIIKYEKGEIVPLSILEKIAEELSTPIRKKVIRRLGNLRNKYELTEEENQELIDIYNEILEDDEEYEYE